MKDHCIRLLYQTERQLTGLHDLLWCRHHKANNYSGTSNQNIVLTCWLCCELHQTYSIFLSLLLSIWVYIPVCVYIFVCVFVFWTVQFGSFEAFLPKDHTAKPTDIVLYIQLSSPIRCIQMVGNNNMFFLNWQQNWFNFIHNFCSI